MNVRYRSIIGLKENNCIYNSDIIDSEKYHFNKMTASQSNKNTLNKILWKTNIMFYLLVLYNEIRQRNRHIFYESNSSKENLTRLRRYWKKLKNKLKYLAWISYFSDIFCWFSLIYSLLIYFLKLNSRLEPI